MLGVEAEETILDAWLEGKNKKTDQLEDFNEFNIIVSTISSL
jgi:hypothetical protein